MDWVVERSDERRVRKAPRERIAVYNWAVKGFKTTPTVGRRLTVKPMDIATYGTPWTKFVVPITVQDWFRGNIPSIGSTIHVGESSRTLS